MRGPGPRSPVHPYRRPPPQSRSPARFYRRRRPPGTHSTPRPAYLAPPTLRATVSARLRPALNLRPTPLSPSRLGPTYLPVALPSANAGLPGARAPRLLRRSPPPGREVGKGGASRRVEEWVPGNGRRREWRLRREPRGGREGRGRHCEGARCPSKRQRTPWGVGAGTTSEGHRTGPQLTRDDRGAGEGARQEQS